MEKNKIISLLLVILFIFPMLVNVASATSINPVLKITIASDLFGTGGVQSDMKHFAINNSGNIDLYYIKGDRKVYKYSGGAETTLYTGRDSTWDDYYKSITLHGDKIIIASNYYTPVNWKYSFTIIDLTGTLIGTTDGAEGANREPVSTIFISPDGAYAYYVCENDMIVKINLSTRAMTIINPSTTLGGLGTNFFYPITGSSNEIGLISFQGTNAYNLIINTGTDAVTKYTLATGASGIDATYPNRIIHNSLLKNEAGVLNGAITIHGAPTSGSGLAFYNFYCVAGTWNWEFRQYAPAGYDYPTRGCVWAYHDGTDALSLSWYKDAYTTKQLYTASISFASTGAISAISCSVDATTTEYPISTQTVWASEYVFKTTVINSSLDWWYNHGYFPSTAGNYRVEFYAYGGSFTAFYTVTGQTSEAEQPSGFYDIGGLDITNTYNTTDSIIYYIRQSFAGNVTLSRISVLINETFVNATCYHNFAYVIWKDNDLIYMHNASTSTNGTSIYYDDIDELISTGGTIRAGFVSWGDDILGVPLGVGYSASNDQTYYKSFSGVADDLETINWAYEGNSMTEKLAIQVMWYSNYVAPQYQEGGGDGEFSIVNGTIVINTNVNGTIGGTDLTDQTTPVGTAILNAFTDWGYGASAGGYILWVCLIIGITMLMTKAGLNGSGSALVGLVCSAFVCWGLGLVGVTIVVLSILMVIVLASKEIVGLVRGA